MSEQHSYANPSPAGLIALAVGCFCSFSVLSGRVSPMALPFFAAWQFGGFIVQLITGIFELKNNNVLGGNVFLYFGSFFMLTGAIESMTKYILIVHKLPLVATIDGWGWLVLAISTTVLTVGYLLTSPFLLCTLVLCDVAVWLVALANLQLIAENIANPIAAWFFLANGILGLYVALGTALNSVFKRSIIPLGRPFIEITSPSEIKSGGKEIITRAKSLS